MGVREGGKNKNKKDEQERKEEEQTAQWVVSLVADRWGEGDSWLNSSVCCRSSTRLLMAGASSSKSSCAVYIRLVLWSG